MKITLDMKISCLLLFQRDCNPKVIRSLLVGFRLIWCTLSNLCLKACHCATASAQHHLQMASPVLSLTGMGEMKLIEVSPRTYQRDVGNYQVNKLTISLLTLFSTDGRRKRTRTFTILRNPSTSSRAMARFADGNSSVCFYDEPE